MDGGSGGPHGVLDRGVVARRPVVRRAEFDALLRPLVGMVAGETWRGAGSAIFLELGALTTEIHTSRRLGEFESLRGEATLMLQWSWRVESPRAIQFGSWSEDPRISRLLPSLVGRTVLGLQVTGRLPELAITLSGDRWLNTFMTAEGQPAWSVRLPDDRWFSVRRGVIVGEATRIDG